MTYHRSQSRSLCRVLRVESTPLELSPIQQTQIIGFEVLNQLCQIISNTLVMRQKFTKKKKFSNYLVDANGRLYNFLTLNEVLLETHLSEFFKSRFKDGTLGYLSQDLVLTSVQLASSLSQIWSNRRSYLVSLFLISYRRVL